MKNIFIAIDTNGLIRNDKFPDILSISVGEFNLQAGDFVATPFSVLFRDFKVNDSTKFHGLTDEILQTYGSSVEEGLTSFFNYLANECGVVFGNTTITLIGLSVNDFILPLLNNLCKKYLDVDFSSLVNIRVMEVLDLFTLMYGATNFTEICAAFKIKNTTNDSLNKITIITKLLKEIRWNLNSSKTS